MTRANDILQLLLARRPDRLILERRTGLPYGWGIWLRSLPALARPFNDGDVVAQMLQRPPAASGGVAPMLPPWRAFRQLFWQDWDPPPHDQRWMRWTAAATSFLLHVLFAALLVWAALISMAASQPDAEGGEGGRVQVAFIGEGGAEGGAEGEASPAEAASAAAASAGASPARPQPSPAPAASEPPDQTALAEAAPPVPPSPQLPATPVPVESVPAADQPLQVTETAEPVGEFQVPPPTVRAPVVTSAELRPREVQVREREVPLVERPPMPVVQVREPALAPRALPPAEVQVREREITLVQAPVVAPVRVPQREVQARVRELGVAAVREREIPLRERPAAIPAPPAEAEQPAVAAPTPATQPATSGTAAAPATAATAPSASTAPASAQGQAPTASPTTGREEARAPAGRPAPAASTGASDDWSRPARGDDWSTASRAGPSAGRGEGVFNRDGSVRLPGEGPGQAERGAPGGDSDTWTRERIAASGTWLKRPPYDHTPTSFDKYWVPSESLLAEWVRKGIKNIEIPIPGTNTRISCVVSLLQFGGGCGLSNPNMQEQPAQARPPPDVPFKKELQEENGSR
ncbi:hypothetical protein [Stenotrophomonas sp. Marseille-Q4652]|uniref:hypothetical protein n=1 Tax=Stenotrophomonas sp. Marseille-Q4652 TaxID=2866595 RepID=UPI001CE3C214|nr:hypothetical protein [Stenotrophomonas sp. Marseille-Q4652]